MDDLLIMLYDKLDNWIRLVWSKTEVEDTLCPLAALLGLTFGLVIPGNEILPDTYQVFSSIMGWTYFFMWAISFWPQVVTNYKNQDTMGLKSDKLAYDLIGFECLVIYESSMYFSTYTRGLYIESHNGNSPEVEINDVWFANHSMLLTFIVIGQMVYYNGWRQWPTTIAVTICSVLIGIQVFALIVLLVYGRDIKALSFLTWLYLLSAIKVIITFLKFLPQVLYNYERKSTQGWSMPGTQMDLIGSVLSISQLVLDCYFMNDWKGVEGNFIKLGLGMISGTYDVIFIVQHYMLYPGTGDDYKKNSRGHVNDNDSEIGASEQGLLMHKRTACDSDKDSDSDEGDMEVMLSPFTTSSDKSDRIVEDNDIYVDRDRESEERRFIDSGSSEGLLDMDVTWIVS